MLSNRQKKKKKKERKKRKLNQKKKKSIKILRSLREGRAQSKPLLQRVERQTGEYMESR